MLSDDLALTIPMDHKTFSLFHLVLLLRHLFLSQPRDDSNSRTGTTDDFSPSDAVNALATVGALGGTVAFLRKKSLPSLIGGLGFSALYAISGYLIQNNKDYGIQMATGPLNVFLESVGMRGVKVARPSFFGTTN